MVIHVFNEMPEGASFAVEILMLFAGIVLIAGGKNILKESIPSIDEHLNETSLLPGI